MKVSLSWLKELVDFNLSPKELADKLSLTSIGVKEQTADFLELDLTYNRGDLLSLRGVAREVAAITNTEVTFKEETFPKYDLPKTPVKVEEESLSPVQCVAKIEGLKFGKSPEEWVQKLNACGMRTVNNIADVTNLIMLEYGQPLHSFDAETVKDELIDVRLAKEGEEIRTLDNKLRKLTTEDIVLADTEKPLDVAGVMGGKDTEIKESTTTILLSASMFNSSMVRKTSKRLGLYSEASKRFQHGLTKTNLLQALSAAIKMYESLGGKLTAITLVGNLEDQPKTIKLSREKINSLIGMDIPGEQVEDSLKKLGFTLMPEDQGWEVTSPYWRLDINIEEDLIEEVARMYGYEKIAGKSLSDEKVTPLDQSFYEQIYNLKVALRQAGLTEVETYSFYSSKVLITFHLPLTTLVKVANPISTETEYLRENLWPNLLEVAAKNIRNGIKDVAIFELGKVYSPQKGDLPKENYHLSIVLSNGTDNPIQELNQIAQEVISHPRGVTAIFHPGGGTYEGKYFHPTRFAALEKADKEIGFIAEIHPRFVNKFGIDQRVAVLEIALPDRI